MPNSTMVLANASIASGSAIPNPDIPVYTATVVGTNIAGRLQYWTFEPTETYLQILDEPYNPNSSEAMKVFRRGSSFAALGYIAEEDIDAVRNLLAQGYIPIAYDGDPALGSVVLYFAILTIRDA